MGDCEEKITLLSYTIERLLVCGVCYEEFRQFSDAQSHLFTHTKKKIFSCQLHIFGEKLNHANYEAEKQCQVSPEILSPEICESAAVKDQSSDLDELSEELPVTIIIEDEISVGGTAREERKASHKEAFPCDSANDLHSSETEEPLNIGDTSEEILITDEIEISARTFKSEEQIGRYNDTFGDLDGVIHACTVAKENQCTELEHRETLDRCKVLRELLRPKVFSVCKLCGKDDLLPYQEHQCSYMSNEQLQKLGSDVMEINSIATGLSEKALVGLSVNENESENVSKALSCSQHLKNHLPMSHNPTSDDVHRKNQLRSLNEPTLALSGKLNAGIIFVTYTTSHVFCCGICNEKCKQINDIHEHMQAHLLEGAICGLCRDLRVITRFRTNRPSSKSTLLLVHARKKPYMCGVCKRTYENMYALELHIVVHVQTENNRFPCKMCGSTFITMRHLKQHTLMHNNLNQCDICHLIFPDPHSLNKHEPVHRKKNLICKECKVIFILEDSLKKHMSIHHEVMHDTCRRGICRPTGRVGRLPTSYQRGTVFRGHP